MDLAPVCLQSWARDHESGRRGQISIFHRWVDAPPARESYLDSRWGAGRGPVEFRDRTPGPRSRVDG